MLGSHEAQSILFKHKVGRTPKTGVPASPGLPFGIRGGIEGDILEAYIALI